LAISDNGGINKERRQFDAWGLLKKHFKGNVETLPSAIAGVDFELLTDRGYTGHEHFFSVGIIHMNAPPSRALGNTGLARCLWLVPTNQGKTVNNQKTSQFARFFDYS
jgi:hypothetical protein